MASEVLIFMSTTIFGHIKTLVEPRAPSKGSEDSPGERNIKEDKAVSLVCVLNVHFSVRSSKKVYFPQMASVIHRHLLEQWFPTYGSQPLGVKQSYPRG